MSPYLGKIVLYVFRSGQVRQGMTEAAAIVRRVHADNSVNLMVIGDGAPDPLFLERVPAMSETVKTHCWHLSDNDADTRIAMLEAEMRELRQLLSGRKKAAAA